MPDQPQRSRDDWLDDANDLLTALKVPMDDDDSARVYAAADALYAAFLKGRASLG